MPMASIASLVATLRDCRLLEPSQLDELSRDLQGRLADPRALARELVRRGWLTPYQVNQLAQGRGRRLSLGQYVLLERLGEGGMGEVFKARHRKLGRLVALKIIRKDRLANDLAVKRFCREIQAAAHLEHPNVVRAYDADEADGTHFFAMEYVEGTDLAKLVKQHGPLPVGQACDCVRQAALALQHAFERGMVHRDIKPHNLLLNADGVVKVLDMGLARLSPEDADGVSSFTTLTQEGAVMGTPDFIAPEQAMDSHTADIRADLYSLGCTFYYLLTGCVPFPRGSALEKLLRHQKEEPRPVEALRPDVPTAVAAVVRRLMAKRPQDRFQTPAELAVAVARATAAPVAHADARPLAQPVEPAAEAMLSEFAGLDTGESSATTPLDSLPRRKAERRRLLLIGVAGGGTLLVLLGLLAFLLARLGSPPRDTGKGPSVAADESAQAELDVLLAREKDRSADRARLWDDVVAFSLRHPVRARDAHVGAMLLRLPSPLAALDAARVPAEARLDGLPKEAVAVLGAGLPWHGVTGTPHAVFTADGSALYCQTVGGTVAVCDPVTGRLGPHFGAGVTGFDLRPDGKAMLTTAENAVHVWDLSRSPPREAYVLKGVPGRPGPVRYSRDGKMAAVSVSSTPAVTQLWDLSADEPKLRATLKGHTDFLALCDFSPDGKRLATTSHDGTVRLWDLTADPPATKAVLQTQGRQWWAESASFSPDGTLLAWTGAHDRIVHVCDVAADPPKELTAFSMTNAAEGVLFSPDGKMLAAGVWDGNFVLWDVNGKTIAQRAVVPAHTGIVWSVSFSPDGKSLATASQDGTLRVWDITGREPKDRVARHGHTARVTALAFAPDGKSLLSGSEDATVRFWDLAGAEPHERATLVGHRGQVTGVAFAADGAPVSGGAAGGLSLWDVATGKPRADLCDGGLPAPAALAATPDGRTLAAALNDRRIRLWDLGRPSPESRAVEAENRGIYALALSADGKTLAVSYEDATVRLWGAAAVQPREWGTLRGKGQAFALAFAPDGKTLASGGTDFAVTLWDVAAQKPVASLAGHTDQVRGLAFAPDGKTVASAALDGRVILWDLAPGRKEPKRREWKLPWPVTALAAAPDGRHLAAGFGNGAVIVLRLK